MKFKFATAINCIDGRVQAPVTEFIKNNYDIDYVDMITEPGTDKVLSENKTDNIVESIKRRVLVSLEKHGSKMIIVAGHYDCAGNPVKKEEHLRQIKEAVQNIKEWSVSADVYGVWIDENWEVILV